MDETITIGKNIIRKDAKDKVSGKVKFNSDSHGNTFSAGSNQWRRICDYNSTR